MPEIIALDFGLKRTGIAISDAQQIIATPLVTINSEKLLEYLEHFILERKITEIVIGYPTRLNGKDSHITQNVLLLKEAIEKKFDCITLYLQDERFTSKIASQTITKLGTKKQKKNKALVDQISATIILQDFLNEKKSSTIL